MLAAVAAMPLLLGGTSLATDGEDAWVQGDDYQTGDFGRVLYSENGVTLIRVISVPVCNLLLAICSGRSSMPR